MRLSPFRRRCLFLRSLPAVDSFCGDEPIDLHANYVAFVGTNVIAIEFDCPQSGTRFNLSDSAAGKLGRCNKCEHRMKIPAATPRAAPVATTGRFHLDSVQASLAAIAASADNGSRLKASGSAAAWPALET